MFLYPSLLFSHQFPVCLVVLIAAPPFMTFHPPPTSRLLSSSPFRSVLSASCIQPCVTHRCEFLLLPPHFVLICNNPKWTRPSLIWWELLICCAELILFLQSFYKGHLRAKCHCLSLSLLQLKVLHFLGRWWSGAIYFCSFLQLVLITKPHKCSSSVYVSLRRIKCIGNNKRYHMAYPVPPGNNQNQKFLSRESHDWSRMPKLETFDRKYRLRDFATAEWVMF